jgi:beta-N-acetylhexosaminidase
LDEAIDGLARAQAECRWQPDPASVQRSRTLLPASPALAWDALMRDGRYRQALEWLP